MARRSQLSLGFATRLNKSNMSNPNNKNRVIGYIDSIKSSN